MDIRKIIREEIELLTERMSGSVYHFTTLSRLDLILQSNTFELSRTRELEVQFNRGRSHFGSFTTVKYGGRGFPLTRSSEVRIIFDSGLLANNHKIVGAQWHRSFQLDTPSARSYTDENEVRIISNKKTIPNISKYIKAIDVRVYEPGENDYWDNIARSVLALGKKMGIPVRFYDFDEWKLGRVKSDLLYTYYANDAK